MRGATDPADDCIPVVVISIHAPHARSDICPHQSDIHGVISIHAPHARSDGSCVAANIYHPDFNPRSSCEERRFCRSHRAPLGIISIHAPHARSDSFFVRKRRRGGYFNPRSSCEERRQWSHLEEWSNIFQSTLLMRGATVSLSSIDLLDFIIHFSRTTHLFPKTLLLALCLVSPIFCVMALRA